jgi:hypothetical protein
MAGPACGAPARAQPLEAGRPRGVRCATSFESARFRRSLGRAAGRAGTASAILLPLLRRKRAPARPGFVSPVPPGPRDSRNRFAGSSHPVRLEPSRRRSSHGRLRTTTRIWPGNRPVYLGSVRSGCPDLAPLGSLMGLLATICRPASAIGNVFRLLCPAGRPEPRWPPARPSRCSAAAPASLRLRSRVLR